MGTKTKRSKSSSKGHRKSKYTKTNRVTTKSSSIRRKGRQCRIKYLYIIATTASQKSGQPQFLGTTDDSPIVSSNPQIWMLCRPAVNADEPQYYYLFDELGRLLSHRTCKNNVIMENNIDIKNDHARWMIDNYNHKIIPYENHLMALDYLPNAQYGIVLRRQNIKQTQNQSWEFREKISDLVGKIANKSKRARIWDFNEDDIDDLFVSHQKSKLLKYARKLPGYGYVNVNESPEKIFCYLNLSHWDKYASQFREKIIDYYDFVDSSSLYYFINKYYPFIVKHHGLTPKSKLYLSTKIYKQGYHISLYKDSKNLLGKKIKFKCISLNHLVHRSYAKLLDEPQYNFVQGKYHGLTWFFIETEFKSPMTCSDSSWPIPHVSVGLILYEPSTTESKSSISYHPEDNKTNDISDTTNNKTFF